MAATERRILVKGMSGTDVRWVKDSLYELGYLTVKPTHNIFGFDTEQAVKTYQSKNKYPTTNTPLVVDGKVGNQTWDSIEKKLEAHRVQNTQGSTAHILLTSEYPNITLANLKTISADLTNISETRFNIVKECLRYAYDINTNEKMFRAMYIYGSNLYTTKLTVQRATTEELAYRSSRFPTYFSDGRLEWMMNVVKQYPNLPASDCSGLEVGYLRKFKLVSSTWDKTANTLCTDSFSTAVSKENLTPGDWVGLNGHIGTYVGGGFIVEFVGAVFGCQLTKLDNRCAYDFMNKTYYKMKTSWVKFRRPKYY